MKIISLFLLAVLAAAAPFPAFAWGYVGHAVVADIAESRLTPEARKQVKELLAVEHDSHLSDVSSWADMIKKDHLPGAPAHSLRLALDHSTDVDQTLCPSHYCAVKGIEDYEKVLADKSLPLEKREVALKFVVHLIGDLHQPLHATVATGGNVAVEWHGKVTKLHTIWDDNIIYDSVGKNPEDIAAKLEARVDKSGLFFGGTPTNWALESRDIARDVIYKSLPTKSATPIVLPANYAKTMWPIVAARLTQAGVRLADVLNVALN